MKELVCYNRDKVHEVADRILSICGEPICFERILQEVFKGYGLSMNFEQYVLVGSTGALLPFVAERYRESVG